MRGSEITKFYGVYSPNSATGATRRLSDHLGSTSITTDADGNKVSEMRYTPCPTGVLREGEVRSAWTAELSTTPVYQLTKHTFTGQYSHMDDPTTENVTEGFGLMDYGARMYDPALGRFTSADTIIPSTPGVQGWDRYAYVNNNPVRYTDPTGHIICAEVEVCNPGSGSQVGGGSGSTGSGSSSSGGNSGAVNDNDPDLCNTFGECDNTPSPNGADNGNLSDNDGSLPLLWDLILPTEFGWRLQLEICIKIPFAVGPCGAGGANIVYNRTSKELTAFIDLSGAAGIGEGAGASLTTGPLVGWFASDTEHLTSGFSATAGGTLAYEGAVSVSASSPLTVDQYYDEMPILFYGGAGVGYAYYGGGVGASGTVLSATVPIFPP